MKKTAKIALTVAIILISFSMVFSSCKKESNEGMINEYNDQDLVTMTKDLTDCACVLNPTDTITQEEIDMLIFMREEEKLARDVYFAMDVLYAPPVFHNIAKSEQYHMDMVLCLLQYYNIPDPASADTGVFNNSELQELYNSLIELGSASFAGALTVGATIEDKDIYDLEQDMTLTENSAILNIFSRLSCASGNHIRSFSAHLDLQGIVYNAQFISQEEYESIISLPHQFCGTAGVSQTASSPSVE